MYSGQNATGVLLCLSRYEALQEAKSIDILATRLFEVTDINLDKLTKTEFEAETERAVA